jgi:hypothetical protein
VAPTPRDLETWEASFDRVRPLPEFLPRFYELFRRSSDEVEARFAGTDFDDQVCVLAATLAMIGMTARGHVAAEGQLRRIAAEHDRAHLDIPPELYGPWLECTLRAAAEHDPLWSDAVDRAWRRVLGVAVRLFLAVRAGEVEAAEPIGGERAWAHRRPPAR